MASAVSDLIVACSWVFHHPTAALGAQTGVFRSDLPEKFRLVPGALQGLIDSIDRDLTFAIEVETGKPRDSVSNYDEVRRGNRSREVTGALVSSSRAGVARTSFRLLRSPSDSLHRESARVFSC